MDLVIDGDLISVVQDMILARGSETVRTTKVKGHPTDEDVKQGRVRAEDKVWVSEADTAAKLGSGRSCSWSLYLGSHDGRGGTAPFFLWFGIAGGLSDAVGVVSG